MRCTQFVGLSSKAREFLTKHNSVKLCEYHMTVGMFDDVHEAGEYAKIKRQEIYSNCN